MAEEAGLDASRTLTGATRNQVYNPLEQEDPNQPENPLAHQEERTADRAEADQDQVNITREARQQNIERTPGEDQSAADRGQEIERQQNPGPADDQRAQQPRPGEAERQVRNETRPRQNQPDRTENRNELNPVRQNEDPLNRRIQDIGTNQSPRVRNFERQFQPDQNAIGQRFETRETRARDEDAEQLRIRETSAEAIGDDGPRASTDLPQGTEPEPAQDTEGTNLKGVTSEIRAQVAEEDPSPIDLGHIEDTETNVQRTQAAFDERQARQEARETTTIQAPPQNIHQMTPNSPTSKNPPAPGLEDSFTERVEETLAENRAEEARAESFRQAREAERNEAQEKTDEGIESKQNRDSAAAQTQIGENVDRLV